MRADIYPLQMLLLTVSGWVHRHQGDVITYLVEENRVLKEQMKGRALRLTDDQRRRLAAKAKLLGRRALDHVAKAARLLADALRVQVEKLGGIPTLALVTQIVLDIQPWFLPRYVIPLAGMIFASCMNTVSVAAERFEAECANAIPYTDARNTALQASLIPVTNSLFAVGLVTLPGMMTGQILSGISPLVASQYQIVVMCMLFGASGLSATIYLVLAKRRL